MPSSTPQSREQNIFVPKDIHLPFFSYGVFKPGELAFIRIKDLVVRCSDSSIAASMRIRDGLPLAMPNPSGKLRGCLIQFRQGSEEAAYRRIAELEPQSQYRWEATTTESGRANYLAGVKPMKGSIVPDEELWNGQEDPLFVVALDVVAETLQQNERFDWNLKPLFHLEMAYLLLWSAIERYASLRYHMADKATRKIMEIANECAFKSALTRHVTEKREVCRGDDPSEKVVLDPNSPDKALAYYYQIRSNLVHRGKGVPLDHERIEKSLRELLAIFRVTLKAAFDESRWGSQLSNAPNQN